MTTLEKASTEWSRRAPDERFSSLIDLHKAACHDQEHGRTATVALKDLEVKTVNDGQLQLAGEAGNPANFTNWSFGQVCGRAKAPAAYIKTLPANLAADCLNDGLKRLPDDEAEAILLFKNDGPLTLRAITSDSYSRIWNRDITERLLQVEERGPWQPAPAAFDGSRGLYLGDRNMFAFLVDNERRIFEKGPGGGLSRGFFVQNSEVGSDSFGITTFFYEYVCGNHRVWGASNIREIRLRHVGHANDKAFATLAVDLKAYAEGSTSEDEALITSAMARELGKDKNEVINVIFGLRVPELTLKIIGSAYDLAEKRVDWYGNPRSAWGMSGALTEVARDLPNADGRAALERASQKVLEIAF